MKVIINSDDDRQIESPAEPPSPPPPPAPEEKHGKQGESNPKKTKI
jgi:hypothetical protein